MHREAPHSPGTLRAGASPYSPPSPASGMGRLSGDHSPLPILTYLYPYPAQVYGSRLRLPQVSSADSGEYVCRVENGSDSKEASITISVLHGTHSGPSNTPGEEPVGLGRGRALGPPHFPGKVPVLPSGKGGPLGRL